MVQIGSALRQREQRYVISVDASETWRILDTWHSSLEAMSPDDEVSDASPAVVKINNGQFLALIKEATRLGFLHTPSGLGESNPKDSKELDDMKEVVEKVTEEKVKLENKIAKLEQHRPISEALQLKNKVVDSLMKLAVSEDLNRLSSLQ